MGCAAEHTLPAGVRCGRISTASKTTGNPLLLGRRGGFSVSRRLTYSRTCLGVCDTPVEVLGQNYIMLSKRRRGDFWYVIFEQFWVWRMGYAGA